MSRAPRPSWVTPSPGTSGTLIDFLTARFPRVDRAIWLDRFARGLVQDEKGHPLAPDEPFGGRVAYYREVALEPPAPPPTILEIDDAVVAVDKPPFQSVTPGGGRVTSSLLYQVEAATGLRGLAPVHRLDRHTSGVVLFARSRAVAAELGGRLARREAAKVYEAIAMLAEEPAERRWTWADRLGPGEPFFRRQVVPGEPNARVDVELVEIRGDLGFFELRPHTGQKHQLRVQMAAHGFALLHDPWYPDLLPEAPDDAGRPLGLLARELACELGGRRRVWRSRLPPLGRSA